MMRAYARTGWWLAKTKTPDTPRMRVMADLAVRERVPRPHIVDLFSGAKHAPDELNETEKESLTALTGRDLDFDEMPEHVRAECPPEAEDKIRSVFGKDFATELVAMQEPAGLDIRANTIKITRDKAIEALKKHGIETTPMPMSPLGLRAKGRVHLATTKLLQAGVVEIQDEGSQLIALLCNPKPGQQVLDACAGGGGKTLVLAAQMEGKGRVVAMDNNSTRLARGKPRYVRAGIHNVEARPLDDEHHVKWLRRQKENFDVVLIDAPCTSSGTWRRNPDLRWRKLGPSMDEIMALQREILARFERCVKPGGKLVYATCSLFREENEDQVRSFLSTHDDFELVPVSEAWADAGLPGTAPDAGGMMRLSPKQSGTDGFFAAVMRRKGTPANINAETADDSFSNQ
jgi:16S rRNA (cytosine967-C5)-methyltransferase